MKQKLNRLLKVVCAFLSIILLFIITKVIFSNTLEPSKQYNINSSQDTTSSTIQTTADKDTSNDTTTVEPSTSSPESSSNLSSLATSVTATESNPSSAFTSQTSSSVAEETTSNGSISNKPSSTQNNINTTPSEEFLESIGMTLEEFIANTEALKTCRHCGHVKDDGHYRFIRDKNCPDCGEWVKGYTCHVCD